jgi:decaprenyl-phosphate phosphoribosyltransferase
VITQTPATQPAVSRLARTLRWLYAVIRTTRPRQWPKNLLVFAAPLAAAQMGHGLGYALLAVFAFLCASASVYLVNDAADAERDRLHPRKRLRPVASGDLPRAHAVAIGVVLAVISLAGGLVVSEPGLSAATGAYLVISFLYSAVLKNIAVLEVLFVASGFLLRVLGGSAATGVPLKVYFVLVCSLGALGVAVAKRYSELITLGAEGTHHRPALRHYRPQALRIAQYAIGTGMIVTYLLWAAGEGDGTRAWHLASAVPLALALVRFGVLSGQRTVRPVEDMIMRDAMMLACELSWLILFIVGLYWTS